MHAKSDLIVSLTDASAELPLVGGKGASLARLAAAGLPVPPGFHITTVAFCRFLKEYGLQEQILAAFSAVNADQPATLEVASSQIGQLFTQHAMPDEIAKAIQRAYTDLSASASLGGGEVPVVVRSSATAEDLPEMSFAGQQETYLNIRGAGDVIAAVKKCWASLWTARAIAYRARQGIASDSVAIAVVVQKLVLADAAGVMFTANPLTGKRDEIMINATWGLEEALVSGAVTPDTLKLDKISGKFLHQQIAQKQTMTVRAETGTREVPVPGTQKKKAVLTDVQAAELARYGLEIENLYGQPMDIEWALVEGRFAILQARPITSLREVPFPEPPLEWLLAKPHTIAARLSLCQMLCRPYLPR